MIAMLVIFFWIIAVMMCFWHAAGFVTGNTYDYQYRCKTYHGTKTLFWAIVLVVMYYIPWIKLGVF